MIPENVAREIVSKIHSFPDLAGCPIGFRDGLQSRVLHPGLCLTPGSERVFVIIEEVVVDDAAMLAELERFAAGQGISPTGGAQPMLVTNGSTLGPELLGAGLSCAMTAVSAVGVAAALAAEVPSGGTSTFVLVPLWLGLGMSVIQCGNGIVRVGAILADWDGDTLQRWDRNPYYTNAILVVDAIGVATSAAGMPAATRNLFNALARERAFVARGLSFQRLRTMSKAERMAALREVIDEAASTPQGREALKQAALSAGGGLALELAGGLSVRGAKTYTSLYKLATNSAIRAETAAAVRAALINVIAGLASPVASGLPAKWDGSASGSVNYVINLIDTGLTPGSQGT